MTPPTLTGTLCASRHSSKKLVEEARKEARDPNEPTFLNLTEPAEVNANRFRCGSWQSDGVWRRSVIVRAVML
jgi:hypothetical protein